MTQATVTSHEHHVPAWYSELNAQEKKAFWACIGGWLDAMDVQMFSFAIPAIILAFEVTNADAGLIGTVTLLTSGFGWVAGALSGPVRPGAHTQITIMVCGLHGDMRLRPELLAAARVARPDGA